MIEAKIVEDSIAPNGVRLTTFVLTYPRFIHSELMTHRVFSRNAMSSRAVPVEKMLKQVRENPAMPIHWGKNQPGMQAHEEVDDKLSCQNLWRKAANEAADIAELMHKHGLHKQVANRILEPFQRMHTIVTATEWENFFALRDHPDAEPNFQALAHAMRAAHSRSFPVRRPRDRYDHLSWHLPFVTREERWNIELQALPRISAARCARVSYLNHDGSTPDITKDLALYERLVGREPLDSSPVDNMAYPIHVSGQLSKNF